MEVHRLYTVSPFGTFGRHLIIYIQDIHSIIGAGGMNINLTRVRGRVHYYLMRCFIMLYDALILYQLLSDYMVQC